MISQKEESLIATKTISITTGGYQDESQAVSKAYVRQVQGHKERRENHDYMQQVSQA